MDRYKVTIKHRTYGKWCLNVEVELASPDDVYEVFNDVLDEGYYVETVKWLERGVS